MKKTQATGILLGIALALASTGTMAVRDVNDFSDLDLSLEELMSVVVTSVAKKEQTLAETAAAVHVINADDIRRSGATNVPEALRLAPGVQVARIANNKWAVSIRGFADRFSTKLLVLVDGRSVYTPLFSGVFWEGLSVPLEEIERIEVMRGPGGAIWGGNAVNGVINIITRSAREAGGEVSAFAGSEMKGYGFARYAWAPDPDTAMSIHAKTFDQRRSVRRDRLGDSHDGWRATSAGFKLERVLSNGALHLAGGVSRTSADDTVHRHELSPSTGLPQSRWMDLTERLASDHLIGRWENGGADGSADSLQLYLENVEVDYRFVSHSRVTADIEYQNRFRLGERHDINWGLGYRHHRDSVNGSLHIRVNPRRSNLSVYSLFVQDEITLQPERWRLIAGARLEHNDYTGYAFQPNLRVLWTPDVRNSLWVSVARAVRTPSRLERGGEIAMGMLDTGPGMPPGLLRFNVIGLDDERLDAIDLGWRHQFDPTTSFDLTVFHGRHTRQRGASLPETPEFVLPGYLLFVPSSNNDDRSNISGLEASLDWRPTRDWRLQAHYSWLRDKLFLSDKPGQVPNLYDGVSPRHQFSLRSSLDLSARLQWDAWLRHVSQITLHRIPAYTTLDMRLAWKADRNLTLSLVGLNLLDSRHPEFGSSFVLSRESEIERSFYARVDWKF